LSVKKRKRAVSKKTQKSKSYQKHDWSQRRAPKADSKLRKEYEKSKEYKRRSQASKKGWKRKKILVELGFVESLKKKLKKAEDALLNSKKREKKLIKAIRKKWIKENRAVMESFALFEEVPLREVYDSIFGY
jgi:hypothetical protein